MNVFVIGGGAAGLSAAISAARNGSSVTVLEAHEKPGKKILATGGGRCNYTNMNIDAGCYYAKDDDAFIKTFLYNFDSADALNFFESIGVFPAIRNGYVYPINEEAQTIQKALLNECEKLGVTIRNNTMVKNIIKIGNEFDIMVDGYTYHADKLIIATGGLARTDPTGPSLMYDISRLFAHTIVELEPALTSFVGDKLTTLSGVRTKASVTAGGHTECGEIQFTKDGISGVPIMNICKYFSKEGDTVVFDFVPDIPEETIIKERGNGTPLSYFIPEKLAKALTESFICPKYYEMKIVRVNDFDHAQVTKGGVLRDEIDPGTMESKICPGLYFAGEIIDVDGRCGGYNLHFAWGSGVLAGNSASGTSYSHIMPTIPQLRRWEAAEIGNRRQSTSYE